jgi:hypothetical protein
MALLLDAARARAVGAGPAGAAAAVAPLLDGAGVVAVLRAAGQMKSDLDEEAAMKAAMMERARAAMAKQ